MNKLNSRQNVRGPHQLCLLKYEFIESSIGLCLKADDITREKQWYTIF